MKVDIEKKRLNSVRQRYVFFAAECGKCRQEYIREKMWQVKRWGINKTVHTWHYCKQCMPSKEDVIHEIDSSDGFGIAFVDPFGIRRRR